MSKKNSSGSKLIVSDPDILGGTPVVIGTRIPAKLLARLLKVGYTEKVIKYEYPSLTINKIIEFKKLIEGGYSVSQAR